MDVLVACPGGVLAGTGAGIEGFEVRGSRFEVRGSRFEVRGKRSKPGYEAPPK